MRLNIYPASCKESSETGIFFQNTEYTFYLNGSVHTEKNVGLTREGFQRFGAVFAQHLIDADGSRPFLRPVTFIL